MHRQAVRVWWLPGAVVIAAAWLLFISSFFLPATNVVERGGTPPGTPLIGWDAAISSVALLGAQPLVLVVEPRALLFLLFPLLNLAVLLSPAIALRCPERVGWMAVWLLPSAMLPLILPRTLTGDLFLGFYLWIGSFTMLGVGYIIVSLGAHQSFGSRSDT